METYRILVLGDFHFGESFSNGGARILEQYGYSHSTVHLRPFVEASDSVILNLETPLVDPVAAPSPFKGKKRYINWGAPAATVNELQELGVNAVSLANNHTLDHGTEGLESTFQALHEGGIEWFGAGRTLDEAREPYRLTLPDRIGRGEICFHGSFQYSPRYDRDFAFYADDSSPGPAPLSVGNVSESRTASSREDSLHVAFPHWGAKYAWRNNMQYRLAHRFLRKDYDLVLGHGGHVLQEVHRKQQRWVVYGIGNGNFQSGGRWRKYEQHDGILPFSFWTVLEVQQHERGRRAMVKLYPVYSDNAFTNFQPGPVTSEDFDRVVQALSARPVRPWRFDNPARSASQDDLGHFIGLDLGEWQEGKRPARLVASTVTGDPNEWPIRSSNPKMEDEVLRLNRGMGTAGLALAAQADGASVGWVAPRLSLIERYGKRILATGYLAHESSLGSAIVADKVLTAQVLEEAGVLTPRTVPLDSAEEAVNVAETMHGPVVIKPRYGSKSRGVSTNLTNGNEIRSAYTLAREQGAEVLIQEYIEAADEMRVMASADRAVAVIKRVLPHVVGDGVSTIGQLIEDKNLQRPLNPSLTRRPIPVDALTHRHLASQELALEDVPELGQSVTVRNVAGLSVGADPFQALEVSEPQIKEASAAAVAAVPGLGWGGVDLVIEKSTSRPYVIEINTNAGYGQAVFPTYGQPRDVFADVWKLRHQVTAPEVLSQPQTAMSKSKRVALFDAEGPNGEGNTVNFDALVESSLTRQGYTIEPRGSRVLHVVSPRKKSTWLRRDATAADRAVVTRVMQRHEWVSKLLDIRQIPRPRSQVVLSTNRLKGFVEGRVSRVFLAPVSARWGGPDSNVLTAEEALALKSLPGEVWVQARVAGRRVRVLATREKAWLITTKADTRPLSNESIAAAGRLAVDAVRAVPELRWATVDIVVRPRRIREGRSGGVLVEGLTVTPEFSAQDQVVAGDFDEFVQRLLETVAGVPSLAGGWQSGGGLWRRVAVN